MYRTILYWLFPLQSFLAFVFQFVLIYVICNHSPANLRTLKYILLLTSCSQLVHATLSVLTQFRQVSNLSPIQIWSYGPCRFNEAFVLYIMYHMLQTSAMVSTLSAFFTIYMKYDASEYVIPSKRRIGTVAGILISIVAVSVTCEICLIFLQSLPEDTREHYYILNQNVTDYANVGFVDLSVLPSAINYVIINTLVLGIPCTAEFLRRKVSSKITPTIDTISESKRAQTLTFLNGLTIQVVLPLLLYVPVFLCQLYTTIAKQEVLFQQYLIFELPVLSTVLDPLISMYFITPYRRTIQKRFKREKQATTDAPIPSVFVAL